MMSVRARARRRGALTQDEFLMAMAAAGFIMVSPYRDELHAFAHPAIPLARFVMRPGETYSRALDRLIDEFMEVADAEAK